jgi:hypothetical protein
MLQEVLLNKRIMKDLDSIAEAYTRKSKTLYKQCLMSLEMDLVEYQMKFHKEHPAQRDVIKLYEMLWSL